MSSIADAPARIISLVGNSGVGKSSLVQAGVIGALKRQRFLSREEKAWPAALRHSRRWAYLTMKPGDDPLRALTAAFTGQWFDKPTDPALFEHTDRWLERLRTKGGLSDLITATEGHFRDLGVEPPNRIMLYIDQGEELYARAPKSHQQRFSRVIAEGIADRRLLVMTSLRSDYYGHLQADDWLFPVSARIDVPPLSADSLLAVLKEPAGALGVRFDNDQLVDTLIRGARHEPGALPLLADFMTELWKEMQDKGDGTLRLSSRTEFVHVGAVLAKRADEFLVRNARNREAVKRLFSLKLALVQEEGEPIRRRIARENCTDEEWHLIEQLAAPDWRLLVTGEEHGEPTAEVAHEVLLREWPTLRTWLQDQRDFLVWLGQVERLRKNWDAASRREKNESLLLGRTLTQAEQWLLSRPKDIGAPEKNFISRSIARRNAQRARSRAAVIAATVSLIAIAAFAFYQLFETRNALATVEDQKNIAEQHRATAEQLRVQAEEGGRKAVEARDAAKAAQARAEAGEGRALHGQSTYLAAFARESHLQGNLLRSTLLAVEALPDEKSGVARPLSREAKDLIATSYYQMVTQRALGAHALDITAFRLLPGRQRALTTSHDGTARLWDLNILEPVAQMTGHLGPIIAADASADGRLIITGSNDSTARIWETGTGRLVSTLVGHGARVGSVSLRGDGTMAITGSDDGIVRIWDIESAKMIREIQAHSNGVSTAILSSNGSQILTVGGGAKDEGYLQSRGARVWSAVNGQLLFDLQAKDESWSIEQAIFTRNGEQLIAVRSDETVVTFDARTFRKVSTIPFGESVSSLAVSYDNRLVAVGPRFDKPTVIYEIATGRKVVALAYEQTVHALAFTPDGSRVVTGSDDNTLRVWNARTGALLETIQSETDVRQLAVSDDGLNAAFVAGTNLHVLDLASGLSKKSRSFERHTKKSLSFDPESRHLLSVTENGPATIWNVETLTQKGVLRETGSRADGAAFSPDGQLAAVTGTDEKTSVFRVNPFEKLAEFRKPVSTFAFSPDGRSLAMAVAFGGGTVTDLNRATRSIDTSIGHLALSQVAASADARRLFTTDGQGPLGQLWDLDTGRLLATLVEPESRFNQSVFNPQGTRLVTVSDSDNIVRQFDADTGRQLAVLNAETGTTVFAAAGRLVVTKTMKEEIRAWDTTSGAQVMRLQIADPSDTVSMLVSEDGRRLIARISSSGLIKVVDTQAGREIGTIKAEGKTFEHWQLSRDGRRVLVEGANDLTVYDVETGSRVSRLQQTWASTHPVAFVANRDASRVVAIGPGAPIEMFDGVTGAKLVQFQPGSNVRVLFGDDGGRMVVVYGDGRLELWDATKVLRLAILRGAVEVEAPWQMSKDGRFVLAAIDGSSAMLFDVLTGRRVAQLSTQSRPLKWIGFSADGTRVATTWADKMGLVFDTRTGNRIGEFPAPTVADSKVILSTNGNRVIALEVRPEVHLLDTADFRSRAVILGHDYGIRSLVFSLDGQRIASGSIDNTARVSNSENGHEVSVLRGHKGSVNSVSFSRDGDRVVSASDDGAAILWDAKSGMPLKTFKHRVRLFDARFSPDGRSIAAEFSRYPTNGIERWDIETGQSIVEAKRAIGGIEEATEALSPDARQVAVFSKAEMRVLDRTTGVPDLVIKLKSGRDYGESGVSYVDDPFDGVILSKDGRTAVSRKTSAVWRMLWTTQDYVDHAKEVLPRCLTTQERRSLYLDPEPPAWCVDLKKWPYNAVIWQQWLADVRAGKQVPMPDAK